MRWTNAEKPLLRHALRQLYRAADSSLTTAILHPQNGQPEATPSQAIQSFIMTMAGVWGIALDPNVAERKPKEENPHVSPRKLKRRDKHVKAGKHFRDDLPPAEAPRQRGVSRLRVLPPPKRLRHQPPRGEK